MKFPAVFMFNYVALADDGPQNGARCEEVANLRILRGKRSRVISDVRAHFDSILIQLKPSASAHLTPQLNETQLF